MSHADRPDPLLPLEGTANTRDIGGVAAAGGTVATGRVFRSDNLAKATAADTAKLAELGLVVSIDFRDPFERKTDGDDTLPVGVEALKLPILNFDTPEVKGLVASITAGDTAALKNVLADGGTARLMTRVYEQMVTQPTAHAGFGTALTRIANLDTDMAGLYHCHSGKDRTGWMTAIVYSALGVDRDVIFDDYLASNRYLAASNEKLFEQVTAAGYDAELVRPFMEQRSEYLQASFARAEGDYGSMDAYLTDGLGVPPATLAALRTLLLG